MKHALRDQSFKANLYMLDDGRVLGARDPTIVVYSSMDEWLELNAEFHPPAKLRVDQVAQLPKATDTLRVCLCKPKTKGGEK